MTPTRPRTLLVTTLLAVPVGWMLARVWDAAGQGVLTVSWPTIGLLTFFSLLLLAAARSVHGWVTRRRPARRMGPLVVSRLVALAKASSLAGAALLGGYAGLALAQLQAQVDPGRLTRPVLAGVAAIAVGAAGLVLERSCRVPPGRPEDDDATGA